MKKYYLWLPILLVMASGIYSLNRTAAQTVRMAFDPNSIVYGGKNRIEAGDPGIITVGLERASARDVTSWWTGPWIARHFNNFYRPATSTLWWIQYRTLGDNALIPFQLIHAAIHIGALASLFLFFRALTGNVWVAALGISFWTLDFAALFGLPSSNPVQQSWHEDPDAWVALFYALSCLAFLRAIRRDDWRFVGAAIAAFLVGTWFKEMAYSLPFMGIAILWHEKKLHSHWRFGAALFGAAVLMFALRWHFLDGYGYRFGSNGSWFPRWVISIGGGGSAGALMRFDALPLAFCCAAISVTCALMRKWKAALGAALMCAGCYFATAAVYGAGLEDSQFLRVFVMPFWREFFILAILIVVLLLAWKTRRRGQLVAWLWVVVAYLPAMTTPLPGRGEYLPAVGWGVFFGYTALAVFEMGCGFFKTFQNKNHISSNELESMNRSHVNL